MLKISVVESRNQRRLVLEGKLLAPWVAELRTACQRPERIFKTVQLVIDLKNVTVISRKAKTYCLS